MNDVDIVMHDIQESLINLKKSNGSPKITRRYFSDFVNLSQKITSVMRINSKFEWNAADFSGWNDITSLFKKLRNREEHEEILKENIKVETIFTIKDMVTGESTYCFCFTTTNNNVDPLSIDIPTLNVDLYEADPETGIPGFEKVPAERSVTYSYHLSIPDTDKDGRSINKLLNKINNTEICFLASECYKILLEYYSCYKKKQGE